MASGQIRFTAAIPNAERAALTRRLEALRESFPPWHDAGAPAARQGPHGNARGTSSRQLGTANGMTDGVASVKLV